MKKTDKKPKLLIVTTTFPRWENDPGPAAFVFHHAKALSKYFDVTVLVPHFKGAALKENIDGIKIKRFKYAPEKYEVLTDGAGIQNNMKAGFLYKILALPLIASLFFSVGIELIRGGYKYINSHWLVPAGLLTALASTGMKTSHVITTHAADYDLLKRLPGGNVIIRYLANKAQAIVCVSKRLSRGISEVTGNMDGISIMPMGVDTKTFVFNENERKKYQDKLETGGFPLLLFVGKLSPKKGVDVLVSAVSKLNDEKISLAIAGDGELMPDLKKLVGDLGVEDRVTFLGAVPNSEIASLYSAADVVVVPSIVDEKGETEGMPVVILEALAAGRKVIATTCCSVPDNLIGKGVTEISPADPDLLASKIENVLAGGQEVDQSAVSVYDIHNVAKFYHELITGTKS